VKLGDFSKACKREPGEMQCCSDVDPELVDSFALGIIMFQMLFGFIPFKQAHPDDKFYQSISYGDLEQLLSDHQVDARQVSSQAISLLKALLGPVSVRQSPRDLDNSDWFSIVSS